jgi:predicted nucleotidyltransferase
MEINKIINEFKQQIGRLYGERLKNVVLYGSYARGNADDQNSDIDLAIVLSGQVNPCSEIDRLIDLVTDLNLKHNVLLSIYPVSEENYNSRNSPLLLNIRNEGISV